MEFKLTREEGILVIGALIVLREMEGDKIKSKELINLSDKITIQLIQGIKRGE